MPAYSQLDPTRKPPVWQAVTAGSAALRLLNGEAEASVLGVTSRGLFLHIPPNRVVFFSVERFRGPLTINVPNLPRLDLLPGDLAVIQEGIVRFSAVEGEVHSKGAAGWELPSSRGQSVAVGERSRLRDLAKQVLAAKEGHGLSALLAEWLGLPHGGFQPGDEALLSPLRETANALRTGDAQAVLGSLEPFFGRGSGLTPSGDDLLLGLLLAVDRLRGAVVEDALATELGQLVTAEAYRRTTLLSANLIECAAEGQADERLADALDFLFAGAPELTQAAQGLCGWGNSSGADSLLGMTIALTAFLTD